MTKTNWTTFKSIDDLVAELDVDAPTLESAEQKVADHVHAYRLAQVRSEAHMTQKTLAAAMGVKQPRISEIERGELDSVSIATLRAYVAALGGNLRIVADFGDREFRLTGNPKQQRSSA